MFSGETLFSGQRIGLLQATSTPSSS